jgi:hypothetical protein
MMSDAPSSANGPAGLERPFPWRCPRCRKKAVRRAAIAYQCQRKHQGTTVTVSVPALAVPQCAECGELVFDYVAEAQINDAFRQLVIAAPSMPVRDVV